MLDLENEELGDELIQLSAYIFSYLESKDKIRIQIGTAAILDHAEIWIRVFGDAILECNVTQWANSGISVWQHMLTLKPMHTSIYLIYCLDQAGI